MFTYSFKEVPGTVSISWTLFKAPVVTNSLLARASFGSIYYMNNVKFMRIKELEISLAAINWLYVLSLFAAAKNVKKL